MSHNNNKECIQKIKEILKTYVNLSPINILDKDAMHDIQDLFECYGSEHIDRLLNGNMTHGDLDDFISRFKKYYECGTDNQIIYINFINKIINLPHVKLNEYLNLSKSQTKKILAQYNEYQFSTDDNIIYNFINKKYNYFKLGQYYIFILTWDIYDSIQISQSVIKN